MPPSFFKPNKYFNNLHQGARASTYQHAHNLRMHLTEAEEKLWQLLRNRQIKGKKFRRQHALGPYVLDFYCHECRLAIELDGMHHNNPDVMEEDKTRTTFLQEQGIQVLRFANHHIIETPEAVINHIANALSR